MLKGKNNVELAACSLSSCRTKAETLARTVNTRIRPCTWGPAGVIDGVSNGVKMLEQEDEEFFDASPSPIEDERCCRGDDSSAATLAGRTKLYELLQQHAVDDATDVFYDVSENAEPSGIVFENGEGNLKSDRFPEVSEQDLKQNVKCDANTNSVVQNFTVDDIIVRREDETEDSKECSNCHIIDSPCHIIDSPCSQSSVIEEDDVWNSGKGDYSENDLSNGIEQISIPNSNKESDCESVNNSAVQDSLTSRTDSDYLRDTTCPLYSNNVQEGSNKNSDNQTSDVKELCNGENCSFSDDNSLVVSDEFNPLTEEGNPAVISRICDNQSVKEELSISPKDCESFNSNLACHENSSGSCNQTDPDKPNELSIHITEEAASPVKRNFYDKEDITADEDSSLCDPRRLKVFNETRPLISRSTSLKTGKTPPGTPSRKKIVRFADVLGLDLEDVRHIISGDLPTVPPSAYSDLVLVDEEMPTPSSSTIELKERQQGAWENIHSAIGPNVLYPTFPIPGQQSDFWDRVQAQGICLESVVISDFNVHCTCRVMNWGFSKKVLARYTVNGWMSSNDIDASHVSGSSQRDTDSFTFNIFLPPSYKSVEFALRYEINGKEYWDNNRGKNYCLSCHGNENVMPASMPSSPTWYHQFW